MLQQFESSPVRLLRWILLLASFALFLINLVNPAWAATATTTTLSPLTDSVGHGQAVALVARVTSNGTAVTTGQVQFCEANAKLCFGSGLLGQAQLTSAGSARTVIILGSGVHSVRAVYNGTGSLAASTSAATVITVAGLQPGISLGVSGTAGNYTFTSALTGQGYKPITGNISIVNTTSGGNVLRTAAVGSSIINQNILTASAAGTGTSPEYMASGDFNGDGYTDFAVANLYGNSITILLGNGTGSFTTSTVSLNPNLSPEGLAVGDFNNDGVLDLAVAENNNSAVQIFLGLGNGTFYTGALIPAGFGPDVLAVGDFNHDGQLDIAAVNQLSSTVTILLGQGNGNFAALSQTASIGYFTTSITVGDFNNDGIPDLAVANYYANSATVLLGHGDGTFTPSTLNTGVYPIAITAGDLNNDGKLDLVVANQFSQTLSIFLGDGAGNFTPQASVPAIGQDAQSVALGDFNVDGKLDIAVANATSNTIQIFPGNGNGTFAAPFSLTAGPSGAFPHAVLVADLNSDGLVDIVAANAGINQVQTFLNSASATTTATIAGIKVLGTPAQTVAASYSGDANYATVVSSGVNVVGTPLTTTTAITAGAKTVGLGQVVQITGILTPGSYGALLANGTATLLDGTTTLATGQYSAGVVAFNEYFTTTGSHSLSIVSAATPGFLGSKSGPVSVSVIPTTTSVTTLTSSAVSLPHGTIVTLTATVTSSGKPVTLGTVDFCKTTAAVCEDGALLRAVQLNSAGNAVLKLALPVGSNTIKAVYVGTGEIKGSTSAPQSITVTGQYTPAISATAIGTPGNYTISYSQNMGSWQRLNFSNRENPVNLVDTSNHNLQLAQLYGYSQNFSFTPGNTIAAGASPYASTVGDFNGDGKTDIAFASDTSGVLTIDLGNGNGTFNPITSAITLTNISALVAGDFNGDGKLDLAAVDNAHNRVTIALGNGDGTFTTKSTPATGTGPKAIAIGDFNNDGILDLAVTNSNSLTILLGNGDGTFTADPVSPPTMSTPSGITAADFNGDGYLDLAVSNLLTGTVSVLYGNGDGTFTPTTISVGTGTNPGPLVALDVDQDGKPDLAVVLQGTSQLQLLVNQGNQTFVAESSLYTAPQAINNLIAADFDGDGRVDLAFADQVDGRIFVYFNQSNSYWNESSHQLTANNVGFVSAGDFDSDGGLDLVVAQPASGNAIIELQRVLFSATFDNVSIPGTGSHQIVLTSPAAGVYAVANSNPLTLSALPISADVLVLPSPSPTIAVGQTVNIVVKVLPIDNFVPTATVSLFNGNVLVKTSALTNNQATFSMSFNAAGSYYFTANYNGDANMLAAASQPTPIYVVPVTATSKTTLTLSTTAALLGAPVTVTATTLTAANAPVVTGVINFCDATAKLCNNQALLGTAQLTSKGTASLKLALGVGTHQIKAVYQGSQTRFGSTSGVSTLVVGALAGTTTQLTSIGTAGHYSLTATVTGQDIAPLSGSVSFHDATTNAALGQATLGAAATTTAFNQSLLPGLASDPFMTTSGDFNSDGKPDLAVLDYNGFVSIFLGNGDGTFTAKPAIPVQPNCATLVAGDFNGDGKLDLAATGYNNILTILLGNGDGTFKVSTLNYGSGEIYQLAVGDFNHDGKLDLVGAVLYSQSSPGLEVFLGNGDGTFSFGLIPAPMTTEPVEVAVADFNGDGNLDAAVTNFYGSLLLYYGDGAGSFTLASTNFLPVEGAVGIVTADFNGDGKADLAICNYFASTVTTLLGNGDGTFNLGTVTPSVAGPYNLALADLNLDGKMDLVVASSSIPDVSILLGNGIGGFTTQTIALPPTSNQNGIAIADWNSDSRPDIFLPNTMGMNGSLLFNTTTTSASATLTGVIVGGTANQTVNATYGGSTFYATSHSNSLTLVP